MKEQIRELIEKKMSPGQRKAMFAAMQGGGIGKAKRAYKQAIDDMGIDSRTWSTKKKGKGAKFGAGFMQLSREFQRGKRGRPFKPGPRPAHKDAIADALADARDAAREALQRHLKTKLQGTKKKAKKK